MIVSERKLCTLGRFSSYLGHESDALSLRREERRGTGALMGGRFGVVSRS